MLAAPNNIEKLYNKAKNTSKYQEKLPSKEKNALGIVLTLFFISLKSSNSKPYHQLRLFAA